MTVRCDWCRDPMAPGHAGGPAKRFCCEPCRRLFHQALRTWALIGFNAGLVPIEALRRIASERRARR